MKEITVLASSACGYHSGVEASTEAWFPVDLVDKLDKLGFIPREIGFGELDGKHSDVNGDLEKFTVNIEGFNRTEGADNDFIIYSLEDPIFLLDDEAKDALFDLSPETLAVIGNERKINKIEDLVRDYVIAEQAKVYSDMSYRVPTKHVEATIEFMQSIGATKL